MQDHEGWAETPAIRPSAESDVAGICAIAPAPQISPPFGSAGDRNADNCVGGLLFWRHRIPLRLRCVPLGAKLDRFLGSHHLYIHSVIESLIGSKGRDRTT